MQPSPSLEESVAQTQAIQHSTEITIKLTPFDRKEYRSLINARDQTLRRIVKRLKPTLGLSTAVDAGCGVRFFSHTLAECGLSTCGFDARGENVEEARRRFPGIPFEQADVEAREIRQLGQFDLVLCFGLLYHLENPPASRPQPSCHHGKVFGHRKYVPAGGARLLPSTSGAAARGPKP